MQDISCDDFPILNGGDSGTIASDKDMYPTLICKISNTSPLNSATTNLQPKQTNNEEATTNSIDLFPSGSVSWQKYPTHDFDDDRLFLNPSNSLDRNSTQLLLQGSEDPLISHGANSVLSNDDEHPEDFATNYFQNSANKKSSEERLPKFTNQQKIPAKNGCSNLTKQQLKLKANLMSARNQQQQQQQQQNHQQYQQQQLQQQSQIISPSLNVTTTTSTANQKNQRNQKTRSKKGTTVKLRFHHQALPPEYLSHYEATQGQLQRNQKDQMNVEASYQRNSFKTTNNLHKPSQPRNSNENVRSWLKKIAEIQRTANASKENATNVTQQPVDISQCHPTPSNSFEAETLLNRRSVDANNNYKMQNELAAQNAGTGISTHSATHNGSSLAEVNNGTNFKRSNYSDLPFMGEITLDNCKPRRGRKPKKADICHLIYKNYGTILHKKTKAETGANTERDRLGEDEYEQPLNLCLRDQLNDTYSISSGDEISETNSTCPTPVSTPFDNMRDSMLANTLKKSLNNIHSENDDEERASNSQPSTTVSTLLPACEDKCVLPIAMCYKKLLESGVLLHNANGQYKTIKKDNQLALKIPIPNGFFLSHKLEKSTPCPVGSKQDYPDKIGIPSPNPLETSLSTTIGMTQNKQVVVAPKRKRSAIFIPPMNDENSNNPATEVSICKFKFTGGSKPSLQEKKMISVDAGGNYRYFSGTGDKSSRGYEYFPRESLQQTAGLLPGVNCTGPVHGLSTDPLQISDTSTSICDAVAMDSVSLISPAATFESNNTNENKFYDTP